MQKIFRHTLIPDIFQLMICYEEKMIGTAVTIISYTSDKTTAMCLSVNPINVNAIVIEPYVANDKHQQWFQINSGGGTFAFWDVETQALLVMNRPDGQLGIRPSLPMPESSYSGDETWTLAPYKPSVNWWDVIAAPFVEGLSLPFAVSTPYPGVAIRPSSNSDRNLNILENGPYVAGSTVVAWDG
jgi:hypothetical protein